MKYILLLTTLVSLGGMAPAQTAGKEYTPGQPGMHKFEPYAADFLDNHCMDCHDGTSSKTDVSFEGLGEVNETNAAVWKSIWAQVALQEMPPKKKKQPETIERIEFTDWIVAELQRTMKDKGGFTAHLDPKKGNFLDHDLLFAEMPEGIKLMPPSSPARIWRITPQEHITRLNELINTEAKYDPTKPGLRSHGDVVPTNHGGELKLYFGTDRITKHQGGTVAYATAVKSVPVVLSSNRKHGFENYAHFYSVNSAEATQTKGKAEDILRYMAYGPHSLAKPEQITDDPNSYQFDGDIRGTPSSLVYNTKVVRPLTPVYELMKEKELSSEGIRKAVDFLFEEVTFRPPTKMESDSYVQIVKDSVAKVGKEDGVFMGLSAIFLNQEALFRTELVKKGKVDAHGRVMMQDWELGLAVNHALRYLKPDAQLRKAIVEGKMRTREDVAREVSRMLEDDSTRKPRVLRFFRDYFDHDLGGYICKDSAALSATGAGGRGHYRVMFDAAASTDRLIELILAEDKNVLKELLTTQKVVATRNDNTYFGERLSQAQIKEKAKGGAEPTEKIDKLTQEMFELTEKLKLDPKNKKLKRDLDRKKKQLSNEHKAVQARLKAKVSPANLAGPKIYARVSRKSFGAGSMKPDRILATAPEGQRMGILTHPSWLVSHSDAMDNHAIHRGIWIRERLLGGGIPDVPITVDAQLPDEPNTTLRHRMRVTREPYCWSCHEKMDPLGMPFEIYNHAGIYRKFEQNQPVDTSGEIIDSGDPSLDGPVKDALEMIEKLANSERAEQVFVRHAFRFWMGRNETLHDAPVLQAAHKAYRESEGSMNALILSLVTSDAFLYRTREK